MAKSLVIVESDAKSKTINRFLGNDYIVKASVGHIKNLPKNRLGVDMEGSFEPEYITIRGRGKVLSEMKRLAGTSDRVYLATDPDREGEAIAFHLATEIAPSNKNISRVLFYEITAGAVKEAMNQPLEVDIKKVEAQKARRVMDRIVGYRVSPFLWKTVFRGLSAGRVQSVALRLVCEREREIAEFTPSEYWTLEVDYTTKSGETFRSKLAKILGEDAQIPDEKTAMHHVETLKELEHVVSDLRTKQVERRPFAPYTTSTFQQDASRRLSMSTKQIMAVAQQLYEGIDLPEGRAGLITYMRTDSTRLAQTAVAEAREVIADHYGLEYVPPEPRFFKNKKSAQDAHEAIRPTSARRTPKDVASFLTPRQLKLYTLIYNRFMACQMSNAKIEQTTLDVTAGTYLFRTTGSVIRFRGFMQIYGIEKEEEPVKIPKEISKGESLNLVEIDPEQHFTKPPPRYNESSLVKELDNKSIGRPSTYALIISTLLDRKYVEKENRSMEATDLGMAVNQILTRQFPNIFSVGFTAQMEEELDQVESGEKERVQVIQDFYIPFDDALKKAEEKREEIKESLQEERDERCPQCGRDLVVKWGRNGKFVACTGYPDCKYTKPLEAPEKTDEICDSCGEQMVVKTGKFGRFLACSKYPDCKFTKPLSVGVDCPEEGCEGKIVERKSRKGKIFFGCSRYPSCKFATWYRPVPRQCPQCRYPYMEERASKAKGQYFACPQCKGTVQKSEESEAEEG